MRNLLCPETDLPLSVFRLGELFAVSRNGRHLLSRSLEWSSDPADAASFEHEIQAEMLASRYVRDFLLNAVPPSLIDTARLRVRFRCRHCKIDHVSELAADRWESCVRFVRRSCVKLGLPHHTVLRLWDGDRTPSCKTGDIPHLPHLYCKECFSSGTYVGLASVQTCRCVKERTAT